MSTLAKDAQAIRLDDNLNCKLKKLEYVKTGRAFRRWKGSFMKRYESFLSETKIHHAITAYEIFSKIMKSFIKKLQQVNSYIEQGQLTVENYTVKARMALSEMTKDLFTMNIALETLIPKTSQSEIKNGYNKFHLSVALLRDNFKEYDTNWKEVLTVLNHMEKVTLNEVADKQILEEMNNYTIKIQKFCEIMNDLGLYEVMLKCIEFENDNGLDLSALIYLDCKTGCIGEIPREDLLAKNVLTIQGVDKDGRDLFNEAVTSQDRSNEKLIKVINDCPRLKIGFATNRNQYSNEKENVTVSNKETVQNLWGVKLKKLPKNVEGEEFIFICQMTSQFGEISRQSMMEYNLLHEILSTEEHEHGGLKIGTLIIEDAYVAFQERSELVEKIRSLLSLGIPSK